LRNESQFFPDARALKTCQDRIREKTFISSLGVATAAFEAVENTQQLQSALTRIGYPAILKSNQFGYDGKGQVKISPGDDLQKCWEVITKTGAKSAILEAYVDFEIEVSVIVARAFDGSTALYPVVENQHRNHILHKTIVPARISPEIAQEAQTIASKIATGLNLVGVIAVEMFLLKSPAKNPHGGSILVNELAPRPHNSGHWSIEGCSTSQFEQVVRAICGLPLGSVSRVHPCEMVNLIGSEVDSWRDISKSNSSADSDTHLHLYGKTEVREGRKMGHVTTVFRK